MALLSARLVTGSREGLFVRYELASEEVAWLREKGYRAQRLELGVRDWQERGFAVETGSGKEKSA